MKYYFYIAPDYVLITRNGYCAHKAEINVLQVTSCLSRKESSIFDCKKLCSDVDTCVGFTYARYLFKNKTNCVLYSWICPDGLKAYPGQYTATNWKDLRPAIPSVDLTKKKVFCYGKLSGIIDLSLSLQLLSFIIIDV